MLTARLVVEAPELISNAAEYTAADKAESEEELARTITAEAIGRMVAAMAVAGGKVVNVSTDSVFDGTAATHDAPEGHRNPQSAYGRSKAEAEDKLRDTDLLVRTAWAYAPG